jgi:hypothetical protein
VNRAGYDELAQTLAWYIALGAVKPYWCQKKVVTPNATRLGFQLVLRWWASSWGCNNSGPMRTARIALVLFALAGVHGADLLNADLYLSGSRSVRPLPRGFTGHVARPTRYIRNMMLRNVATGINRGCARKDSEKIPIQ